MPDETSYEALRANFAWRVPARYNIGVDACDRWAEREPNRLALLEVGEGAHAREFSFEELRALSNRHANLLAAQGVERGDRVGILLPQRHETACAHLASYKLGAVALPLFTLFGAEALQHRLADSGACAVVTDAAGAARLAALRDALPALRSVLCVDGAAPGALDLPAALRACDEHFTPVDSRGPGAAHLHLRHDRRAEGRVARAARAARPSARCGDEPRSVSTRG